VGSAVLAMLFMIAWRFPRSPGPLIAMILVGGCVALFDLASTGIHTVGAVQRGLPVPTLPSLTGIDIVSLLLTALGAALVANSGNIVTARAFGARRREPVDNDQELLALGPQICPPPFFMAFPVSSRNPVTIGLDKNSATQPLRSCAATISTISPQSAAAVVNSTACAALAGWRAATRDPDITEAVETGPATNCRRSYHRSQPIAAPGGGSGRGAPQSSAWGSSPIDLA
jgi:sulfate permease, SulP family